MILKVIRNNFLSLKKTKLLDLVQVNAYVLMVVVTIANFETIWNFNHQFINLI